MDRLEFGIAEGGRLRESSFCREFIPELPGALPARFSKLPLTLVLPCTPELPTWPFARAAPFTCEFPNRPAVMLPFIRCTGEREARASGAVRAITARLCTPAGGRATRPLKFALPNVLCWVAWMPTELVTLAPFKVACVTRWPPRLMRSPLTNPLREVVVTARRLCAFTKLKFLLLNTFTLRMNVLWTLITVMKLRLQWNQGKNGSPHPSGNQPTPKPTPNPQPPPRKPTNAGP